MPIQYLYPMSPDISGPPFWIGYGPTGTVSPIYTTVDEAFGLPDNTNYCRNVSGNYTQYSNGYLGIIRSTQELSFTLGNILYIPTGFQIRSNGKSGYGNLILLNANIRNHNDDVLAFYFYNDLNSSGEYPYYDIPFYSNIFSSSCYDMISDYGNINNNIGNLEGLKLNLQFAATGTYTQPDMKLSQIEILMSGTDKIQATNYCTLYTFNSEIVNSSTDLFVSGNYQTFEKIPLFIKGPLVSSGDIALFITAPTGIDDNLTLYTIGHSNINSGIDLHINSKMNINTNMPLFINGYGDTTTKGVTLFLDAIDSGIDYGLSTNNIILYIKSVPVASGEGFDLYIAGPDSGYMYENIPLYIEGYGGSSTDATTLYIQALESGIDYGYGIGTSDLYLNGIAGNSGDPFSLYISAPTSGYLNDNMPLYLNNLDAWSSLYSGHNLYLQALDSGRSTTTLYLKTLESIGISGGTDDNPFNLYISGYIGQFTNSSTLFIDGQQHFENIIPLYLSVAYESSSNFSLFTAGWGSSGNKITNLFISGYGGSSINTTTLYTYGPPPFSGDMPLFIEGGGVDFRTLDTTLYTYNNPDNEFVNSVNLHIVGGFEYGEFPLSLYNDDTPILKNKTATLFTNGFSGVLGKLEQGCIFYIDGTSPNDSMNLYLHNSGIHSHYNTYPLYLSGKDITYSGIANWNTLYIQNEYLHIDYGCEMYLNSQEAYEESGDFNLFIARSTEAIAGNTNLYLAATNGATSEFAMYISGATYSQNNVNLSIPYVESTIINNAKLYTHGF